MQINFTGHQIEVTPAIRQYTQTKLERLQRRFDKIISTNVIFNVEKIRNIAEATIYLAGAEIHASAEEENLYSAIDSLADKLDRQITKYKEKLKDHHE